MYEKCSHTDRSYKNTYFIDDHCWHENCDHIANYWVLPISNHTIVNNKLYRTEIYTTHPLLLMQNSSAILQAYVGLSYSSSKWLCGLPVCHTCTTKIYWHQYSPRGLDPNFYLSHTFQNNTDMFYRPTCTSI